MRAKYIRNAIVLVDDALLQRGATEPILAIYIRTYADQVVHLKGDSSD
jgi:hypothetical protein